MAIRFTCQCGKQLQAKDNFAGRRMKCPDCGNVLEIPASTVQPAAAPPEVVPVQAATAVQEVVPVVPASPPPVVPVVSAASAPVRAVKPKPNKETNNIWATNSLDQQITPWSTRDNLRTGKIPEAERGSGLLPFLLLLLVLLIGIGVASYIAWPTIQEAYQTAAKKEAQIQQQNPYEKFSDLDLIPRDGVLFVSFRVADWWDGPARDVLNSHFFPGVKIDDKMIEEEWGLSPGKIERITVFAPQKSAISLAQPSGLCALITTKMPYNEAEVQKAITGKVAKTKAPVIGQMLRRPHLAVAFLNKHVILIGRDDVVRGFVTPRPNISDIGPLERAVQLADSGEPFVAGINVSAESRMSLLSDAPEDWTKLLGVLFESDATTLSINRLKKLDFELQLSFADAAKVQNAKRAADGIKDLLEKLIPQARDNIKSLRSAPVYRGSAVLITGNAAAALFSPLGPLQALAAPSDAKAIAIHIAKGKRDPLMEIKLAEIQRIEAITKTLSINSEDDNLHVALSMEEKDPHPFIGIADFLKDIHKTAQFKSRQNLTQIAAALHQYHAVHGHFPSDGEKLSWRVELLPYLGHTTLYKNFDLKKAWDDNANSQYMSRMPKVFAPAAPLGESKGMTHYQIFAGLGAAFETGKKVGLADIKDGASNTVLVVESPRPVTWIKPGDLSFEGDVTSANALRGLFTGRIWAVFADGSVRRLPANLTDEQLRGLVTISGGEKK